MWFFDESTVQIHPSQICAAVISTNILSFVSSDLKYVTQTFRDAPSSIITASWHRDSLTIVVSNFTDCRIYSVAEAEDNKPWFELKQVLSLPGCTIATWLPNHLLLTPLHAFTAPIYHPSDGGPRGFANSLSVYECTFAKRNSHYRIQTTLGAHTLSTFVHCANISDATWDCTLLTDCRFVRLRSALSSPSYRFLATSHVDILPPMEQSSAPNNCGNSPYDPSKHILIWRSSPEPPPHHSETRGTPLNPDMPDNNTLLVPSDANLPITRVEKAILSPEHWMEGVERSSATVGCIRLVHSTRVMSFQWKETGMYMDKVFVPLVLAALVEDGHCVLWQERGISEPFGFEMASRIQLVNPEIFSPFMKNSTSLMQHSGADGGVSVSFLSWHEPTLGSNISPEDETLISLDAIDASIFSSTGGVYSADWQQNRNINASANNANTSIGLRTVRVRLGDARLLQAMAAGGIDPSRRHRSTSAGEIDVDLNVDDDDFFERDTDNWGSFTNAVSKEIQQTLTEILDSMNSGFSKKNDHSPSSNNNIKVEEPSELPKQNGDKKSSKKQKKTKMANDHVVPLIAPAAVTAILGMAPCSRLPLRSDVHAFDSDVSRALIASPTWRVNCIDLLLVSGPRNITPSPSNPCASSSSNMAKLLFPGVSIFAVKGLSSQPRRQPMVRRLHAPECVSIPIKVARIIQALPLNPDVSVFSSCLPGSQGALLASRYLMLPPGGGLLPTVPPLNVNVLSPEGDIVSIELRTTVFDESSNPSSSHVSALPCGDASDNSLNLTTAANSSANPAVSTGITGHAYHSLYLPGAARALPSFLFSSVLALRRARVHMLKSALAPSLPHSSASANSSSLRALPAPLVSFCTARAATDLLSNLDTTPCSWASRNLFSHSKCPYILTIDSAGRAVVHVASPVPNVWPSNAEGVSGVRAPPSTFPEANSGQVTAISTLRSYLPSVLPLMPHLGVWLEGLCAPPVFLGVTRQSHQLVALQFDGEGGSDSGGKLVPLVDGEYLPQGYEREETDMRKTITEDLACLLLKQDASSLQQDKYNNYNKIHTMKGKEDHIVQNEIRENNEGKDEIPLNADRISDKNNKTCSSSFDITPSLNFPSSAPAISIHSLRHKKVTAVTSIPASWSSNGGSLVAVRASIPSPISASNGGVSSHLHAPPSVSSSHYHDEILLFKLTDDPKMSASSCSSPPNIELDSTPSRTLFASNITSFKQRRMFTFSMENKPTTPPVGHLYLAPLPGGSSPLLSPLNGFEGNAVLFASPPLLLDNAPPPPDHALGGAYLATIATDNSISLELIGFVSNMSPASPKALTGAHIISAIVAEEFLVVMLRTLPVPCILVYSLIAPPSSQFLPLCANFPIGDLKAHVNRMQVFLEEATFTSLKRARILGVESISSQRVGTGNAPSGGGGIPDKSFSFASRSAFLNPSHALSASLSIQRPQNSSSNFRYTASDFSEDLDYSLARIPPVASHAAPKHSLSVNHLGSHNPLDRETIASSHLPFVGLDNVTGDNIHEVPSATSHAVLSGGESTSPSPHEAFNALSSSTDMTATGSLSLRIVGQSIVVLANFKMPKISSTVPLHSALAVSAVSSKVVSSSSVEGAHLAADLTARASVCASTLLVFGSKSGPVGWHRVSLPTPPMDIVVADVTLTSQMGLAYAWSRMDDLARIGFSRGASPCETLTPVGIESDPQRPPTIHVLPQAAVGLIKRSTPLPVYHPSLLCRVVSANQDELTAKILKSLLIVLRTLFPTKETATNTIRNSIDQLKAVRKTPSTNVSEESSILEAIAAVLALPPPPSVNPTLSISPSDIFQPANLGKYKSPASIYDTLGVSYYSDNENDEDNDMKSIPVAAEGKINRGTSGKKVKMVTKKVRVKKTRKAPKAAAAALFGGSSSEDSDSSSDYEEREVVEQVTDSDSEADAQPTAIDSHLGIAPKYQNLQEGRHESLNEEFDVSQFTLAEFDELLSLVLGSKWILDGAISNSISSTQTAAEIEVSSDDEVKSDGENTNEPHETDETRVIKNKNKNKRKSAFDGDFPLPLSSRARRLSYLHAVFIRFLGLSGRDRARLGALIRVIRARTASSSLGIFNDPCDDLHKFVNDEQQEISNTISTDASKLSTHSHHHQKVKLSLGLTSADYFGSRFIFALEMLYCTRMLHSEIVQLRHAGNAIDGSIYASRGPANSKPSLQHQSIRSRRYQRNADLPNSTPRLPLQGQFNSDFVDYSSVKGILEAPDAFEIVSESSSGVSDSVHSDSDNEAGGEVDRDMFGAIGAVSSTGKDKNKHQNDNRFTRRGALALTTRDVLCALLAQSEEANLDRVRTVAECSSDKQLTWHHLRRAGAGFWLRDRRLVKEVAESLARQVLGSNPRDGNLDDVAMWYIAMGKKTSLQSLYRSKGNDKVSSFLMRDFENDPKQRQAAQKNGFELMRQKRHSLSVAFFLLGGDISAALDVIAHQLEDIQLALFFVRLIDICDPYIARYTAMDVFRQRRKQAIAIEEAKIDKSTIDNSYNSTAFDIFNACHSNSTVPAAPSTPADTSKNDIFASFSHIPVSANKNSQRKGETDIFGNPINSSFAPQQNYNLQSSSLNTTFSNEQPSLDELTLLAEELMPSFPTAAQPSIHGSPPASPAPLAPSLASHKDLASRVRPPGIECPFITRILALFVRSTIAPLALSQLDPWLLIMSNWLLGDFTSAVAHASPAALCREPSASRGVVMGVYPKVPFATRLFSADLMTTDDVVSAHLGVRHAHASEELAAIRVFLLSTLPVKRALKDSFDPRHASLSLLAARVAKLTCFSRSPDGQVPFWHSEDDHVVEESAKEEIFCLVVEALRRRQPNLAAQILALAQGKRTTGGDHPWKQRHSQAMMIACASAKWVMSLLDYSPSFLKPGEMGGGDICGTESKSWLRALSPMTPSFRPANSGEAVVSHSSREELLELVSSPGNHSSSSVNVLPGNDSVELKCLHSSMLIQHTIAWLRRVGVCLSTSRVRGAPGLSAAVRRSFRLAASLALLSDQSSADFEAWAALQRCSVAAGIGSWASKTLGAAPLAFFFELSPEVIKSLKESEETGQVGQVEDDADGFKSLLAKFMDDTSNHPKKKKINANNNGGDSGVEAIIGKALEGKFDSSSRKDTQVPSRVEQAKARVARRLRLFQRRLGPHFFEINLNNEDVLSSGITSLPSSPNFTFDESLGEVSLILGCPPALALAIVRATNIGPSTASSSLVPSVGTQSGETSRSGAISVSGREVVANSWLSIPAAADATRHRNEAQLFNVHGILSSPSLIPHSLLLDSAGVFHISPTALDGMRECANSLQVACTRISHIIKEVLAVDSLGSSCSSMELSHGVLTIHSAAQWLSTVIVHASSNPLIRNSSDHSAISLFIKRCQSIIVTSCYVASCAALLASIDLLRDISKGHRDLPNQPVSVSENSSALAAISKWLDPSGRFRGGDLSCLVVEAWLAASVDQLHACIAGVIKNMLAPLAAAANPSNHAHVLSPVYVDFLTPSSTLSRPNSASLPEPHHTGAPVRINIAATLSALSLLFSPPAKPVSIPVSNRTSSVSSHSISFPPPPANPGGLVAPVVSSIVAPPAGSLTVANSARSRAEESTSRLLQGLLAAAFVPRDAPGLKEGISQFGQCIQFAWELFALENALTAGCILKTLSFRDILSTSSIPSTQENKKSLIRKFNVLPEDHRTLNIIVSSLESSTSGKFANRFAISLGRVASRLLMPLSLGDSLSTAPPLHLLLTSKLVDPQVLSRSVQAHMDATDGPDDTSSANDHANVLLGQSMTCSAPPTASVLQNCLHNSLSSLSRIKEPFRSSPGIFTSALPLPHRLDAPLPSDWLANHASASRLPHAGGASGVSPALGIPGDLYSTNSPYPNLQQSATSSAGQSAGQQTSSIKITGFAAIAANKRQNMLPVDSTSLSDSTTNQQRQGLSFERNLGVMRQVLPASDHNSIFFQYAANIINSSVRDTTESEVEQRHSISQLAQIFGWSTSSISHQQQHLLPQSSQTTRKPTSASSGDFIAPGSNAGVFGSGGGATPIPSTTTTATAASVYVGNSGASIVPPPHSCERELCESVQNFLLAKDPLAALLHILLHRSQFADTAGVFPSSSSQQQPFFTSGAGSSGSAANHPSDVNGEESFASARAESNGQHTAKTTATTSDGRQPRDRTNSDSNIRGCGLPVDGNDSSAKQTDVEFILSDSPESLTEKLYRLRHLLSVKQDYSEFVADLIAYCSGRALLPIWTLLHATSRLRITLSRLPRVSSLISPLSIPTPSSVLVGLHNSAVSDICVDLSTSLANSGVLAIGSPLVGVRDLPIRALAMRLGVPMTHPDIDTPSIPFFPTFDGMPWDFCFKTADEALSAYDATIMAVASSSLGGAEGVRNSKKDAILNMDAEYLLAGTAVGAAFGSSWVVKTTSGCPVVRSSAGGSSSSGVGSRLIATAASSMGVPQKESSSNLLVESRTAALLMRRRALHALRSTLSVPPADARLRTPSCMQAHPVLPVYAVAISQLTSPAIKTAAGLTLRNITCRMHSLAGSMKDDSQSSNGCQPAVVFFAFGEPSPLGALDLDVQFSPRALLQQTAVPSSLSFTANGSRLFATYKNTGHVAIWTLSLPALAPPPAVSNFPAYWPNALRNLPSFLFQAHASFCAAAIPLSPAGTLLATVGLGAPVDPTSGQSLSAGSVPVFTDVDTCIYDLTKCAKGGLSGIIAVSRGMTGGACTASFCHQLQLLVVGGSAGDIRLTCLRTMTPILYFNVCSALASYTRDKLATHCAVQFAEIVTSSNTFHKLVTVTSDSVVTVWDLTAILRGIGIQTAEGGVGQPFRTASNINNSSSQSIPAILKTFTTTPPPLVFFTGALHCIHMTAKSMARSVTGDLNSYSKMVDKASAAMIANQPSALLNSTNQSQFWGSAASNLVSKISSTIGAKGPSESGVLSSATLAGPHLLLTSGMDGTVVATRLP